MTHKRGAAKGVETVLVEKGGRVHTRPSERTALFILRIIEWCRGIVGTTPTQPHGRAFQHCGRELPHGKALRYPSILLVEDNPGIAAGFIEAIRNYYVFGTVHILVAHTYKSAVTFFENEDVSLVIMDADLDDIAGDGAALTLKFLGERPEITILANSSSTISSLKLTGFGARESLGKSPDKLKNWLLRHDRSGQTG
jgi:CheY-like chemotaxis protein